MTKYYLLLFTLLMGCGAPKREYNIKAPSYDVGQVVYLKPDKAQAGYD